MKKLFLITLCLLTGNCLFAQKLVPAIKTNTVISYNLTQDGLISPLTFTITDFGSPITIDWNIEGYGKGSFEMKAESLDKGNTVRIGSPVPDQITTVDTTQTIACISKAAFTDLVKTKGFVYDKLKFTAVADKADFKLGSDVLDVIHAVANKGKVEIWILNNPDFPLICRTKNYVDGSDIDLTAIK